MTFLVTFLATVVILVVLRTLLWLSQGLFLPAGVFFIAKKHKNRLASVIFAKMDFTITPTYKGQPGNEACSLWGTGKHTDGAVGSSFCVEK